MTSDYITLIYQKLKGGISAQMNNGTKGTIHFKADNYILVLENHEENPAGPLTLMILNSKDEDADTMDALIQLSNLDKNGLELADDYDGFNTQINITQWDDIFGYPDKRDPFWAKIAEYEPEFAKTENTEDYERECNHALIITFIWEPFR